MRCSAPAADVLRRHTYDFQYRAAQFKSDAQGTWQRDLRERHAVRAGRLTPGRMTGAGRPGRPAPSCPGAGHPREPLPPMRLRVPGPPGCPAAVSPAEQEGEGRDADADLIGVCPAGALAGLPAASPASRRSQSRLIARLARSAMPGTGSCPGDGAAWRHSSTAGPWCRQRAREPLTAEIASSRFPVRLPASQKVCTRHGIWLTDSYHPRLAFAEGAPT